ncbi:MAG: histidine--tRNA ligase [Bdellovibrionota bacterium]|nr:MAG: histidine--tRNA ligase [Bdellovibrionota bacterium]
MAKISNISGFPEWLPQDKRTEDELIAKVKAVYESFGFTPIETPAVELVSTLAAKGVLAQEIFGLHRLQAEPGEREADLALHFDLTVPFARYVAQHYHELDFPFKRYQLQKVWRGDRPQKGRFREFYQFDVDTICRDELPLAADAEVLTVLDTAFSAMAVAPHLLYINSRKVLQGIYQGLGIAPEAHPAVIVAVDKFHKVGAAGVSSELAQIAGVPAESIGTVLKCATICVPAAEIESLPALLAVKGALLDEGLSELKAILQLLPSAVAARIQLDFSLARGLAYYTGLITEVRFPDHPEFGSVGGGGRYDDLTGSFLKAKLPGVGMSIGLTRIMDLVIGKKLLPSTRRSPSQVLVSVYDETQRGQCNACAERLRSSGIAAEVYLTSLKLGKQIEYAERKGIPYVLFIKSDGQMEMKDLRSKEQHLVHDLAAWRPS